MVDRVSPEGDTGCRMSGAGGVRAGPGRRSRQPIPRLYPRNLQIQKNKPNKTFDLLWQHSAELDPSIFLPTDGTVRPKVKKNVMRETGWAYLDLGNIGNFQNLKGM